MSEEKVVVFSSATEKNIKLLKSILKEYKIDSEVRPFNNSFQLIVSQELENSARVIIEKNTRKNGHKNVVLENFISTAKNSKITCFILLLCIICYFISDFGKDLNNLRYLFYSDVLIQRSIENNHLVEVAKYTRDIKEINSGQFWRLITPLFIQSDILLFLLNITFFFQFSRIVEKISGPFYLVGISLVTLLCSFYLQHRFAGPYFGGLSTLTFAIFGFLWIRNFTDMHYFAKINKASVLFMGLWLLAEILNIFTLNNKYSVICALVCGSLLGYISSLLLPQKRAIPKRQKLY